MCIALSKKHLSGGCCAEFIRSMNRFICFVPAAPLVVFTAHLPHTGLPVSECMQAQRRFKLRFL